MVLKKVGLLSLLLGIIFASASVSLFAQDAALPAPSNETVPLERQTLQQRVEERSGQRAVLAEDRVLRVAEKCEAADVKIESHQVAVNTFKQKHVEQYNNLTDRLSIFSDRAEKAGLDVTALETALTALSEEVGVAQENFSEHDRLLTSLIEAECVEAPRDFYASLQDARLSHTLIKEDVQAVNTLIRTDVKNAVADLKIALEVQANTPDTSETSVEEGVQ